MQRIGDWSFDPCSARIRRGSEERHLDPKEASVLAHLVEEAPNPVSVEALLDRSWHGLVVGDNAVHQVVGRLRRALGDSARRPLYIETLPKRGYRLMVFDESAVPRVSLWRRRKWSAAVFVLMGGVAALWLWTTGRDPLPGVVVQPFVTHSPDVRILHLARGLEDEVVHAISRNPALAVLGSAVSHNSHRSSIVLAGRLRPAGENRVRASFRAESAGRTIWTRNFDVDIDEPLAVQVAVADEVSVTIGLINDLIRSLEGGTNDDRALVAVLRGRLMAGSDTLEGATEALAYYDQAIRLDPDFAAPYALKATVYRTFANWYAMDTREAVGRMRKLIDEALVRDPELPLALLVSVAIKLYDGAYTEAEHALRQALAGTSDGAPGPRAYAAILLAHCGRFDESLEILDQVIHSNPVHPRYLEHYKAQFLWYARRYDEALTVLDQVLAVTPEDKRAHELRGHVLQSLGRFEEAVEELAWQFPKQQGWMRTAYAEGGVEGIAQGYLRHADNIAKDAVPFTPKQSAWRMYVRGYAMLGDVDKAVAWMEEGWSLGDRWEFFYNRVYPWPGFDELRAHPAFKDLMTRTVGNPTTCPGYRFQLAEQSGGRTS